MVYSFDEFELDTDSYQLRRGGAVVAVEPQVFDVLVHLVQRRGRVVSKQELFEEVWGTNFVSESALTTRIKQARQAVGDDGRAQRVIRTAHGRGYQFVASVLEQGSGGTASFGSGAQDLVERERELAAMRDAFVAVQGGGGGRIVVISGEPGMGKTALVTAFTAALDDRQVLAGGCDDLITPRPLGPFRDMASGLGRDRAGALAGDADADSASEAILILLAEKPTVLLIEDLHWADDATLDVIRLIARRIATLSALVVLTYRDEEVGADHPLRRLLAVVGGVRTQRMALEPLSVEAVTRLAAAAGTQTPDLHRITRGNPFFVTEVLSSPDRRVPATVRDVVLGRVGTLSPAARRLVETVSVVPSRVERQLLTRLLPDAVSALPEVERGGVLSGDPSHVWFRHELTRLAVETSLTSGERLHANAAVFDALERSESAELSRLVHHATQAGETQRMLQYAEKAADEAVRLRAYRQANDYLSILLDQGSGELDPTVEVRLRSRRSYVLYVLNRLGEATLDGRRAVELADSLDPARFVDAYFNLSRAAYWTEGPIAARRCIERAIAILGDSADETLLASAYAHLARALSNLATLGIVAEPDPAVVVAAEHAISLAEGLGRSDLQSHALQYLGSGRLALGDERGFSDLEEAVALAEVDPRDELPVRACVNAAGSAYRSGRLDEAVAFAELGLDRTRLGEFFAGEYRLQLTIAAVLASKGDWSEADDSLRRLIDRPGEPGIMGPMARSLLARLHARRGLHDDAEEVLTPALDAAIGSREIHLVGPVAAAAVELWWLGGADGDPPKIVTEAVDLGNELCHRSSVAELVAYLQRAGRSTPQVVDPPGPWASTLTGAHRAAADEWRALGDRYEAALELAATGDFDELRLLGASGALAVMKGGHVDADRSRAI